jgi:hypothetical protein
MSLNLKDLAYVKTRDEFLVLLLKARNDLGGRVLGEMLNLDGSTVNNILRSKKASPISIARISIPLATLSELPREDIIQKLCNLFLTWTLSDREVAFLDEKIAWKKKPPKVIPELHAERLFVHCAGGFCLPVNYTLQEEIDERTLVLEARERGTGLKAATWYQMRLRTCGAAEEIGFTKDEARMMEREYEKNNPGDPDFEI